jgi:hypothetical protein
MNKTSVSFEKWDLISKSCVDVKPQNLVEAPTRINV